MYNVFKRIFISLLSLCTEFKDFTTLIKFLVLEEHLDFLLRGTKMKMENQIFIPVTLHQFLDNIIYCLKILYSRKTWKF